MYDRSTNTLWEQFTGEPVIGPLADSGIRLPFFPVTLTTWGEWLAEHPDTTVISLETGYYRPDFYAPEEDMRAIYYEYGASSGTMFLVWNRSGAQGTRDVVLGLEIDESFKAYPVAVLQQQRVINDVVGGTAVVVIGSSSSQAARAYERKGSIFSIGQNDAAIGSLPTRLVDSDGAEWRVTEENLVNNSDPSQELKRIPSHTSFWFGWLAFHPKTEVYTQDDG